MTRAKPSEWTVKSCVKETPDAMRITFARKQNLGHAPIVGAPCASVELALPTTPIIQRRYSLISPIHSNEPTIIVKDIKGGAASDFFHRHLKSGDVLEMKGVQNTLWKNEWSAKRKSFVCFAGGIGINPIYSLMQWGLAPTSPQEHRFKVYYGSRSPRHGLLSKELNTLKAHDRLELHRIYSERSNDDEDILGHITKDQVVNWLSNEPKSMSMEYVICGPFGMMQNVHAALDELGIPDRQRHTEYFTDRLIKPREGGLDSSKGVPQKRPQCVIEIEQDSGVQTFTMHGEGKSILKAALEAGLDVPHSCRGGVCLSCKATVIKGEIRRNGVSGLSEEEKESGKILCCRTQPKTDALKLRFDQ
jgi:ring-1,2-phenylacetyl-CoA epoxidase subunit PaaE